MSESIPFNAIIIDDSPQAIRLLRYMLKDLAPNINVVGEAQNVEDGLLLIQDKSPDVIFLDIEMPGRSGIQLAEELRIIGYSGNIVFTTAYSSYAIKAFRLSAIDYLLKPISEDQLLEAINKISKDRIAKNNLVKLEVLTNNLNDDNLNLICIPVQGGYEYLQINEICYLEADGSYVRIISTNNKQKLVSKNLKYFENSLESIPKFIRPHRSFLVNLDHITSYSKTDGGYLTLSCGNKIPVSRERKHLVQDFLKSS